MLPYKCVLYCSRSPQKLDILLCASGHYIYSFDNSSGELLSKWPSPTSYDGATNPTLREHEKASGVLRLTPEVVVDPNSPRSYELDRSLSLDRSTAVIELSATSDNQYVIAVTDEDKCIRVLKLQDDGSLVQYSARYYSMY